jgi:hypothetical protein
MPVLKHAIRDYLIQRVVTLKCSVADRDVNPGSEFFPIHPGIPDLGSA